VAVWFDEFRLHRVSVGVVHVDALDSTDVILKLLQGTRTDVIFLSGASFAGFNIVDCRSVHDRLRVPVIIISREKPHNAAVKRALKKHFEDWKKRWGLVQDLGTIHTFAPKPSDESLHFEAVGISAARARRLIKAYCATSRVPEPIRVAGIMAKGLALAGRELSSGRHEIGDAESQRLKVHDGK